jgi:hypothetical protein
MHGLVLADKGEASPASGSLRPLRLCSAGADAAGSAADAAAGRRRTSRRP